ncbi:MAG: tetratricopeptide repeat protein [Bacteroidota bacterium]
MAFVFLVMIIFSSCSEQAVLYKREYTEDEKITLSQSLLNAAGTDLYYQGSPGERMIIHEGNSYNPNNAWGQRELGVPYLKRGFAAEAYHYYTKAVEYDAEEWLGYKAYCWLYFYRDYEMVLKEVERFDAFTPNFVDYPQATSVNYMRGICYLQLGRYEEAVDALTLHLNMEVKDVGHQYIDAMPYLTLAMSYHKLGQYEAADSLYSLGILYNSTTSDLYFYKAQNLIKLDRKEEALSNLNLATEWFYKGSRNARPYVEEFFAIYEEDLDEIAYDLSDANILVH